MRFLADAGVSMVTVRELRALGHDAVHLVEHEKALQAGAVVVVEDGRSRARSLPLDRRRPSGL